MFLVLNLEIARCFEPLLFDVQTKFSRTAVYRNDMTTTPQMAERITTLIETIVLARHGRAPKMMPSEKDEERTLNELGITQAKKLGAKIGNIKFDTVVSSPLKRAVQTLEIVTRNESVITIIPSLTCPTDGIHPIDRMFNELGYKPLSDYFAHELGEHLKVWALTALVKVLDALGNEPSQSVLVGGHAVLQNALSWAICGILNENNVDAKAAGAMMLTIPLSEGEAFRLTYRIRSNPDREDVLCEHIKLD